MNIDVEERARLAKDYFKQGYNCTQSVVMAFQDVLGVGKDVLERLSIGLGGGVGRMREVCGAVSGMAIVAGSLLPSKDLPVQQQKHQTYALIQDLAAKFREENGSIVCRELLALRSDDKLSPQPQTRNAAYYKARPCEEMVATAARLLAERLAEN